jgi:hypothetical protein
MPIIEPGREQAVGERIRELERRRSEATATVAGIEEEFRKRLEGSPSPEARRPDLEELRYQYYQDSWNRLPEFANLQPASTGELPRGFFDVAPRQRDEGFAFVFEGALTVPKDGTYTFYLDSDDGSRLVVADKVLIEYDGIHGLGHGKSGRLELPAGRVPIRLDYFQRKHTFGLNVSWSGPEFSRRTLSASDRDRAPVDVATRIRDEGERVLGAERYERYRQARKLLADLLKQKAITDTVLCVTEAGPTAPDTYVLLRGNPHVPGDRVEPAFPEVLGAPRPVLPSVPADAKTTGRRSVVADWIVSPANPLSSRVMANRLVQHHFGRGIVRSPSNFGLQGDRPTHPELLDWLAAELMAQGWRLKPLHRLIMTSNAYRMSSRGDAQALAKDPANDLFWRIDMRRLTAEEIRDSVLAASGALSQRMYGPGVFPEMPAEVLAGQSMPGKGWGKSTPEEQARRSIYIHVKRSLLVPMLEGFDLAEPDRSTPVRFSTTQPTQALAMLNGDFPYDHAGSFADRLRREAGDYVRAQVRLAMRLATAREPGEKEILRGVDLIESLAARGGGDRSAALRAYCLLVFNLNEFHYVD